MPWCAGAEGRSSGRISVLSSPFGSAGLRHGVNQSVIRRHRLGCCVGIELGAGAAAGGGAPGWPTPDCVALSGMVPAAALASLGAGVVSVVGAAVAGVVVLPGGPSTGKRAPSGAAPGLNGSFDPPVTVRAPVVGAGPAGIGGAISNVSTLRTGAACVVAFGGGSGNRAAAAGEAGPAGPDPGLAVRDDSRKWPISK